MAKVISMYTTTENDGFFEIKAEIPETQGKKFTYNIRTADPKLAAKAKRRIEQRIKRTCRAWHVNDLEELAILQQKGMYDLAKHREVAKKPVSLSKVSQKDKPKPVKHIDKCPKPKNFLSKDDVKGERAYPNDPVEYYECHVCKHCLPSLRSFRSHLKDEHPKEAKKSLVFTVYDAS